MNQRMTSGIVFLGDSITARKHGFADILSDIIPNCENYAVSGYSSEDLLHQLRNNSKEIGKFNYSITMIGTNDAEKEDVNSYLIFRRNFDLIVTELFKSSLKKQFYLTIPPIIYDDKYQTPVSLINDTKRKKEGVMPLYNHVIDVASTVFKTRKGRGKSTDKHISRLFDSDGFHPNQKAHNKIALEILSHDSLNVL